VSTATAGRSPPPPPDPATGDRPAARHGVLAAVRGWRPRDPGQASLRRAARAAILVPAALALALTVIRDPQVTLFLAFGAFALMVLADFGGRRRQRAAAYGIATVVGAGMVALGTVASGSPWTAAAAMLVVGFVVQFAGVFGGYVAAGQSALLLSFVLAVAIPAPAVAIGPRLEGWALAGAIATAACTLLWPRQERKVLRALAASACRALADLVTAMQVDDAGAAGKREAVMNAVRALSDAYVASGHRPAGPTARDRALAELVSELERASTLVGPGSPLSSAPAVAGGDVLAALAVETLRTSAVVLEGGAAPDLARLKRDVAGHRRALEEWAAQELRDGRDAGEVLDLIDRMSWLRALSYLVTAVGASATVAAGRELQGLRFPAVVPRRGLRAAAGRVWSEIRIHLSPSSPVLHAALRAGLGLALAVLLARLLNLGHAFWAVLGTLSVIRSSALATGRTTVQAIGGTLLGFAVAAGFVVLAGDRPLALWIAMPPAAFLAAYSPTAINFVVGQAAFTVMVVVLFNVLTPQGWSVGLVRVEDIALGAAIGVVVGLLLWPRGARTEFARCLGTLYLEVANLLRACVGRLVEEPGTDPADAWRRAQAARERAGEAFERLLNERATKHIPAKTGGALLAAGNHAILIAEVLEQIADQGYVTSGCERGAAAVALQVGRLACIWSNLAGCLGGEPFLEPPEVAPGPLREAAEECLRAWGGRGGDGRAALGTVLAGEWLRWLARLATGQRDAVERVAETAAIPWWR
jgi:uncharacterized membrane protein YccC